MARRDEEMMNYPGARPIGMSYVMSAELTGLHLDDYLKRNLALRLPGLEDFGMRKTRKGRCTNSDQTCVPGSASSEDVVHIEARGGTLCCNSYPNFAKGPTGPTFDPLSNSEIAIARIHQDFTFGF
ncbi:unnamed protein product [Nesidiocoris tenuis]|uniref:Uncharacterized protein n=1 Tax=Nesidiocoris tenuis TaxID=355587 RepID=A0A6H5GXV7_9HEMI|nr:unnamed protein product [Nesidiocoris tenuis]